ncbi:hypothetical protein OIU85_003415 [Salix viminalis]|uniref:Sororin C-terminal region domain-containing protein n=1 Tax=Salix viminalis TaxID=40686 RepID=A0A9Q0T1E2_SALVM|nr:hypothetical protein OIU85_003415 [Salix viminalis]
MSFSFTKIFKSACWHHCEDEKKAGQPACVVGIRANPLLAQISILSQSFLSLRILSPPICINSPGCHTNQPSLFSTATIPLSAKLQQEKLGNQWKQKLRGIIIVKEAENRLPIAQTLHELHQLRATFLLLKKHLFSPLPFANSTTPRAMLRPPATLLPQNPQPFRSLFLPTPHLSRLLFLVLLVMGFLSRIQFTLGDKLQQIKGKRSKGKAIAVPVSFAPAANTEFDWDKMNEGGVTHPSKSCILHHKKKQCRTLSDEDEKNYALLQDFIEQQRAYFAEIDAFELSEAEVDSSNELD